MLRNHIFLLTWARVPTKAKLGLAPRAHSVPAPQEEAHSDVGVSWVSNTDNPRKSPLFAAANNLFLLEFQEFSVWVEGEVKQKLHNTLHTE